MSLTLLKAKDMTKTAKSTWAPYYGPAPEPAPTIEQDGLTYTWHRNAPMTKDGDTLNAKNGIVTYSHIDHEGNRQEQTYEGAILGSPHSLPAMANPADNFAPGINDENFIGIYLSQ